MVLYSNYNTYSSYYISYLCRERLHFSAMEVTTNFLADIINYVACFILFSLTVRDASGLLTTDCIKNNA